MNKVSGYFKDSYKELMEKVSWPTWAQLQQTTMIVLAGTLIITAIVWIMDIVIAKTLELIYSIF
jgi:preprotein translocase subunit SecE